MERNHERVIRFQTAKLYDSAAYAYLLEAIYLYLEEKYDIKQPGLRLPYDHLSCYLVFAHNSRIAAEQTLLPEEDFLLRALKEAGTFSKLWLEAVRWDDKVGPTKGNRHFFHWCARAAMARGHADWLRNELQPGYCMLHFEPAPSVQMAWDSG
jgi:hypothetical protein